MNEQQLDKAIGQLSSELQPQRDLWPAIDARLTERQVSRGSLWYLATAAALALACVLSWRLVMLPQSAASYESRSAELILMQLYEQQKAQQLKQIAGFAEGFDDWQQQLQVWDQAIAQVRRALQFYPDEPQLLAQLQHLYQQQLAYLSRAALPQPSVNSLT